MLRKYCVYKLLLLYSIIIIQYYYTVLLLYSITVHIYLPTYRDVHLNSLAWISIYKHIDSIMIKYPRLSFLAPSLQKK